MLKQDLNSIFETKKFTFATQYNIVSPIWLLNSLYHIVSLFVNFIL